MEFSLNKEIAIHVTDLSKSVEFYKNVLGFKLISENEDMAAFNCGDVNFYLVKDNKIMPPVLSFTVKDVTSAKEYLVKSGCKIIEDSGKSFYAEDINGIVFDFIENDN